MRIAIIADIHGNLEALTAVLNDIKQMQADRIIGLGDNIGYGPDSTTVLDLLLQHEVYSVLGNHEQALFDTQAWENLNFQVQENNRFILAHLSPEHQDYCRHLPVTIEAEGALFVHGFPPDQVNIYCYEIEDDGFRNYFQTARHTLCFIGHTHRLSMIAWDGSDLVRQPMPEGQISLRSGWKYLINAGSVGQPREKSAAAKYVLWDTKKQELDVRYVDYDPEPTMAKIRALGFPDIYAARLAQ